MQWHGLRSVAVRAGQFKVPFGLQRQIWSALLEFVTISAGDGGVLAGARPRPGVLGRPLAGRLQYELGRPQRRRKHRAPNDNLDLAYAARVVAAPFGPLPPARATSKAHAAAVDGGRFRRLQPACRPTSACARATRPPTSTSTGDGHIDNVAFWQGGFELRALWRGASLQAEWFGRAESIPAPPAPTRNYWGGYVPGELLRVCRRGYRSRGAWAGTDLPLYGAPTDEQRAPRHARRRGERRGQLVPARPRRQAAGRLHATFPRPDALSRPTSTACAPPPSSGFDG